MAAKVASVIKTLNILDLLADHHQGLRVSDIAKMAEVPYTTAHRLVRTLEETGYVQASLDTGRYMLSLKILQLYRGVSRRMNLKQISFPHLMQLMESLGETVHLAVLNEGEVVYVDTVLSPRSLVMYTEVGKRAPVHCTALGKVLTAYLSEAEVLSILRDKGVEPRTPKTIADAKQFLQELKLVRKQGYAVDNEEVEIGVRCVASSVINHMGEIVAAVSVSAPKGRLPMDIVTEVAEKVMSTCNAISMDFGTSEGQLEPFRGVV